MNIVFPWIRIILAVLVYIRFAYGTQSVVRNTGGDLKEMKGRTPGNVVTTGIVANLGVLAVTLSLLVVLDGRSPRDLGTSFASRDGVFSIVGASAIFAPAIAYVALLKHQKRIGVEIHLPASDRAGVLTFASAIVVLLAVAAQEEVLFRGYFALNLTAYGPVVIMIASTVIFAGIHVITNRVSICRMASWLLGGWSPVHQLSAERIDLGPDHPAFRHRYGRSRRVRHCRMIFPLHDYTFTERPSQSAVSSCARRCVGGDIAGVPRTHAQDGLSADRP